jgi:hypothetical protein
MSNELTFNPSGPANLPAHITGVDLGVTKELMAAMFQGGNRIGLKGSRFRLVVNGKEEGVFDENYLDVIILGAAPAVSRMYYEGTYKQGDQASPACYSADGITPAMDVKSKQDDKCMTCPQNVKGSKNVDGNLYKACGYFRRVVVMLAGDVDERRVFKLEVRAGGLFGDGTSDGKKQNLNDYIKMVGNRGIDVAMLATRISFDTNSSVPKLLFEPNRYISAEELEAVRELVASDEVKNLKEVTMATVDLSHEVAADETPAAEAPQQPAAAQRPAPQQPSRPAPQRPQTTAQQPARPDSAPQRPTPAAPTPIRKNVPVPAATEVADDAALEDILNGLT